MEVSIFMQRSHPEHYLTCCNELADLGNSYENFIGTFVSDFFALPALLIVFLKYILMQGVDDAVTTCLNFSFPLNVQR